MKALVYCLVMSCAAAWALGAAAQDKPFVVDVVDEQTGRGVPLVELRSVDHVVHYTDSAGTVAISEPGWMGRRIFFFISSHGYEFPRDGFGSAGVALEVKPGGTAKLRIKRINVAERLYRVTGEGVYRDTLLAGRKAPISQPLSNALVAGQDSVQGAVFRGKIYWFWGDTSWLQYPLGHFGTAGAVSELPQKGGLDPSVGVNLNYFADEKGFSRPMLAIEGPGAKWVDGVMILRDEKGEEKMVAKYAIMKSLGEMMERGLVMYDQQSDKLAPLAKLPLKGRLHPEGHPVKHVVDGVEYWYFVQPYPTVRVRADLKAVVEPAQYEAWTPLVAGTRFDKNSAKLEKDPSGKVVWGWKRDTDPITEQEQMELIQAGKMKEQDAWFGLKDVEDGHAVRLHAGSISWNEHRKRWILIANEVGGKSSYLGEVYYSEAKDLMGPWRKAKKIVTHDQYSFYNPRHHAFFDQKGGRIVYFEGTYTGTFSRKDNFTPRYDYNQLMYRLDLEDERLKGMREE